MTECARCGREIEFSFVAYDGLSMWQDPTGWLTCEEFIEWDDEGEFRLAHTPEEEA